MFTSRGSDSRTCRVKVPRRQSSHWDEVDRFLCLELAERSSSETRGSRACFLLAVSGASVARGDVDWEEGEQFLGPGDPTSEVAVNQPSLLFSVQRPTSREGLPHTGQGQHTPDPVWTQRICMCDARVTTLGEWITGVIRDEPGGV